MLPDWIDVTLLDRSAWIALVVVALLMLFAIRIVVSTIQKVVALLLLFAVGLAIWVYRDDLDSCRQTCSCSLAGFEVDFPDIAVDQCEVFIESRN